jgi:hypothetical protein
VVTLLVVPEGGLGALNAASLPPHVIPADDPDRRWARLFDVSGPPATVLVGDDGRTRWRDTSDLDPTDLAAALVEHGGGGGAVSGQPIAIAVQPGTLPPELPIRLPDGRELTLRRLAGRPVLIEFVHLASGASLEHLEHRTGARSATEGAEPFVVVICDGATQARVDELLARARYPFVVLADPDRRISSRFGVWCWPARVHIGPRGRVESVTFGARTAPEKAADRRS